jgi:hypothetical protein
VRELPLMTQVHLRTRTHHRYARGALLRSGSLIVCFARASITGSEGILGYHEDQQKAAAHERQQVRMGTADPNKLSTISGNMAWKAQQAGKWKPSPSSWSSTPTFPTFPTSPRGSNQFTSPGPQVSRPARPHVPDWTDRLMQRIPRSVLVVCTIIGALIGFATGASSGGAIAIVYALLGAGAGLLAIPAAIKLTQLALRILAVAAVGAILAFISWALTHTGN